MIENGRTWERKASFMQLSTGEKTVLMSAHSRAAKLVMVRYFLTKVQKMLVPLVLATLSNVVAVYCLWRSEDEMRRWQNIVANCIQNTLLRCYLASFLGFFTGFSLNNAFQRYVKGLDHVQQLSVHLRSGADQMLNVLAHSGDRDSRQVNHHAEQVISWSKVYFIQACRGLNSVTLRASHVKLDQTMERWEEFLHEQVQLSEACVAAVAAHSNIFVSTLQMELLWWRWLFPVLRGSGLEPLDTQQARKSFEAARSSFHHAHLLASGITSPVTRWLLEAVMYLFCLSHPWLTVAAFGVWSFLPTLFITYVFFAAQQVSIDLWEPFGIDNPGVADVELFARAQALCEQLDNMLSLFVDGHYAPLDMSEGMHFKLNDSPFRFAPPQEEECGVESEPLKQPRQEETGGHRARGNLHSIEWQGP